jgi:hypothetical protein
MNKKLMFIALLVVAIVVAIFVLAPTAFIF